MTLSVTDTQHNNALHYAECKSTDFRVLFIDCRYAECHYAKCRCATCGITCNVFQNALDYSATAVSYTSIMFIICGANVIKLFFLN